jgi:ketosteroid isomerase-like protein
MQIRIVSALLVLGALLAALSAPATAATVPAAVMAPISGIIKDSNANNTAGLDSNYTSDAVVIDEFTPYVWTGSGAGSRWWNGVIQLNKKMSLTNMRAAMRPIEHFNVTGDKAYVVVPLVITYGYKGKLQKETGTLTLTLQRSGNLWKVATQTWGTLSNTM